ncbi:thioesterase domain-containing protein [Actinoplanes sp. NPDC026623]|uniref:thioesterase II family protein n=1 Tax=Actinoplanes sp. NPDC026623 TaxID=3155610 RepID=UPI0033D17B15
MRLAEPPVASGAGRTSGPAPSGSSWFPFGTGDDARVRLVCLPHAGAGAGFYRSWGRGLPASIAACPVQPPGREKRRSEQPMTSAGEIVRLLTPELIRTVRPPYAIFGHSTGAPCAFEVIRELRRLGGPLPVHLFVAGRRAPGLPVMRTELAGLPPNELAAVLRRLGGTPEGVLANPYLLALLQPLLVADFAVNEDYDYRAGPPLPVPITAFASTSDHFADPAQVAGWRQETSAGFTQLVLEGGHFAIFEHSAVVYGRLAADLEKAAAIAEV